MAQNTKKKPGPKVGKDGRAKARSVTIPESVMERVEALCEQRSWSFSEAVTRGLKKLLR